MRSYFKGTTFDFTLQQNAAVLTNVYINVIVPSQLTCYAYGDFCAYARDNGNNPISVDTNIQVQITWNGDLAGTINATVNIYSGYSCGTGFAYTAGNINCYGEYYSSGNASISPSSSAGQIYFINNINTTNYDTCPC